jgi:hypothetical protein
MIDCSPGGNIYAALSGMERHGKLAGSDAGIVVMIRLCDSIGSRTRCLGKEGGKEIGLT